MKKILLGALFTLFAYGSDTFETNMKYLDSSQLDIDDLRVFIGADGSYGYLKSNSRLDTRNYGYSLYAGMPVFDMEIILKKKNIVSSDFNLENTSFAFNMPIAGTGSRWVYVGIIGGKSKINYSDSAMTTFNLINKNNNGSFYGAHIGKRYKFGENFFVRAELEYLQYDNSSKTASSEIIKLSNTIDATYAIEYRF